MYRKTASLCSEYKYNFVLETIEEEEEKEDDIFSSRMTHTEREVERNLEDSEPNAGKGLNIDSSPDMKITSENLSSSVDTHQRLQVPEMKDCESYYQKKYIELEEFTSNERKIYEESYNQQLTEADSRIRKLEELNDSLARNLREEKYKCGQLSRSQQAASVDMQKYKASICKELNILKEKLNASERKRNELEVQLELLQNNYNERRKELVSSLEDAWEELSEYRDIHSCSCNDEATEGREIENSVSELKNEIEALKQENEKYSKLSQKIQQYLKLKKCIVQESTLHSKISDLECKVDGLTNSNIQLKDDLKKKDLEVREIHTTCSLFREEYNLLKIENEKCLKLIESNKNLNHEISNQKKEIDLSDKINILSKRLKETASQMEILECENSKLKEELNALNKAAEQISSNFEEKASNIQDMKVITEKENRISELISLNSNFKNEISTLENEIYTLKNDNSTLKNDNVKLSDDLKDKLDELSRLSFENTLQREKISSVTKCKHYISVLKEEMEKLSEKMAVNETKIKHLYKLDEENLKLVDEIDELKYKMISLLKISEDKDVKIKELTTENKLLKEEFCTQMKEMDRLSEQIEAKKIKIKESDSERERLKEEIHTLRQNFVSISENLERKSIQIQDLMNENFTFKEEISTLKSNTEKISQETALKVRHLELENSSLKESISLLTSVLDDKVSELKKTKMEEKEKNDLDSKIAALHRDIINLHNENSSVFKIIKEKDGRFSLIPVEANGMTYRPLEEGCSLSPKTISEELNGNITDQMPSPKEEVKGRSQFTCSSLAMNATLEEGQKESRLKKKLMQQRKMLSNAQKREIQLRTNVEMYKNEMAKVESLKDCSTVQNHRIMQLELQARQDDYMHRTRTDCLESFISCLRNENVILKAQLNHVNFKLKKLVLNVKMVRQKLRLKQVGVQTESSSSESCLCNFDMVKSDNMASVVESNKKDVDVVTGANMLEFSQSKSQNPPVPECSSYSVVQIKSEESLEITMKKKKKKICTSVFNRKPSRTSMQSPYHRFIPNLYYGYDAYTKNCNPEGAEGWARLSREFDLLQGKNSD